MCVARYLPCSGVRYRLPARWITSVGTRIAGSTSRMSLRNITSNTAPAMAGERDRRTARASHCRYRSSPTALGANSGMPQSTCPHSVSTVSLNRSRAPAARPQFRKGSAEMPGVAFTRMSAEVRPGRVAASSVTTNPPSAMPSRAARSDPRASRTATASPIHCSRVGGAVGVTGSDNPIPLLS